ncbi:MFS general substrate transporter [Pleomassaria siparia CBS 279.74]|uniref:MFS general substrate transporter n=1 Tax=Pleomassaria siparia CBS 279.74 TaxID=1314801 RepID=A0A6G1JU69_9PLEO|nr:MFS general substrate transporter [Pleomassaria siparia CBS 279.74]
MVSSTEAHALDPNWPRSWRAYVCWLACFFLMFNSWGLVNAYGTFSSYYVGASMRLTDQLQLNLIGSTQSFLVLAFSGPVGRLLDAGHSRKIVATGAFLVPFGMFMLSIAHPSGDAQASYINIWSTQGLVVGLGMACYFVSSSQIAATWFPKRKGLAVGMVACGASIAGVVYPTMIRFLVDALGFNNAVRAVAGLVTLTSLFSLVFATPNPTHAHHKPKSWSKLRTWFDTDALRNKAFCWFTAAVAFLFLGFYPVFFNLEEWAAISGYSTRGGSHSPIKFAEQPSHVALQTFWLLTIMNGSSTLGRLAMALFCDRTGQLNMHIGAQLISAVFVLLFWSLADSTGAAIAFCVCFGIMSGAVIGLPPASIANILDCTYNTPETRHHPHAKLGQWTGLMYSVAAIPALIGPVIAGHLVSEYQTYITVQMWSGVSLLCSAMCMIISRYYLPCVDGERVGTKLARILGRNTLLSDKGKKTDTGESDFEAFSQVTTRAPSRQVSGERLRDADKVDFSPYG